MVGSGGTDKADKRFDARRLVHYWSGMIIILRFRPILNVLPGLLLVAALTGCAHIPRPVQVSEIHSLQVALRSLGPTVREDEAGRVADCAYDYSCQLAQEYRIVRPALWHNFLVNLNLKPRGLCYEWAEDLLAELQTLELDSLELHWGIARAATVREHNSIVVTARGQPFDQGIVLDPWRRGGRMVWAPVLTDHYPWQEGELNPASASSDAPTVEAAKLR